MNEKPNRLKNNVSSKFIKIKNSDEKQYDLIKNNQINRIHEINQQKVTPKKDESMSNKLNYRDIIILNKIENKKKEPIKANLESLILPNNPTFSIRKVKSENQFKNKQRVCFNFFQIIQTLDKHSNKLIERANTLIKIKSGHCQQDPSMSADIKFVIKWKFAKIFDKPSPTKLPVLSESSASQAFIDNKLQRKPKSLDKIRMKLNSMQLKFSDPIREIQDMDKSTGSSNNNSLIGDKLRMRQTNSRDSNSEGKIGEKKKSDEFNKKEKEKEKEKETQVMPLPLINVNGMSKSFSILPNPNRINNNLQNKIASFNRDKIDNQVSPYAQKPEKSEEKQLDNLTYIPSYNIKTAGDSRIQSKDFKSKQDYEAKLKIKEQCRQSILKNLSKNVNTQSLDTLNVKKTFDKQFITETEIKNFFQTYLQRQFNKNNNQHFNNDSKSQIKPNEEINTPKKLFNYQSINASTKPKSQKTFIISTKQPQLIEQFIKRGWKDVREQVLEKLVNDEEVEFDFSFQLFDQEKRQNMSSTKILSVFNGMQLCTKIGMVNILKSAQKNKAIEIDWFFPKCFDMSDRLDLIKFYEQFYVNECQKVILKTQYGMQLDCTQEQSDLRLEEILEQVYFWSPNVEINQNLVNLCLDQLDKFIRNKTIDDVYIIYKLLSGCKLTLELDGNLLRKFNKILQPENIKDKLSKANEQLDKDVDIQAQKATIRRMLKFIINAPSYLQLNQGYNKYILKPHNMSLGVGITVHDSLKSIFTTLKSKKQKQVLQKYMENNLCFNNRKFDIRVWTVITSTAPLVSWVYTRFQVRLSAVEFDIEDNDKYINLTNHAVQKNQSDRPDECMLTYEEFIHFLTINQSKEECSQVISDIFTIIGVTTAVGNDSIERRMNAFIVLGWDLMVDTKLGVWLLECNRSPDLSPSTSITKSLTERMFEDLTKMFCEYNQRDLNQNDELDWVGDFYKLISNSGQKEFNKLISANISKKEKEEVAFK